MVRSSIGEVSRQILDILRKNGFVTLHDLEKKLDVSYNLIFLSVDKMVSENKINLQKCGKEYILSIVDIKGDTPLYDSCVHEYLWQDM